MKELDATPLDILKYMVDHYRLDNYSFVLVRHEATMNWRQHYKTPQAMLQHLEEGLIFEQPHIIRVSGKTILDLNLQKLNAYRSNPNDVVSIASKFLGPKKRYIKHLALMNFHLAQPIDKETLIKAILLICKQRKFWLLKTDRYFHAYGDFLLNENEWFQWNLDYLMAVPLVSPRYIARSLERGFNTLRLNATQRIKTVIPKVIAIVR